MKNLALFCDGTWNTADQADDPDRGGAPCPTNVVRLGYRLANRDQNGDPQIVHYDQGVGSGNAMDRLLGGALGVGLAENVYEAYRFLISNYEAGDRIYLFGFSRGAYTARSIGGMIRKCGILHRAVVEKYPEAVALYRDRAVHPDDAAAEAFRKENAVDGKTPPGIQMVGVWDTVGSLGIPKKMFGKYSTKNMAFHDTTLSGIVKYACHAVAIDEVRGKFMPTLWNYKNKQGQVMEQMWFSGVHSDVGGGYAEHQLSDIALEWMMEKAKGAGLAIDKQVADAHPGTATPTGRLHNSYQGLFRLMGKKRRFIGRAGALEHGAPDPSQKVHPSVLERWDSDPTYRPVTLRAWFRDQGDPRMDQP